MTRLISALLECHLIGSDFYKQATNKRDLPQPLLLKMVQMGPVVTAHKVSSHLLKVDRWEEINQWETKEAKCKGARVVPIAKTDNLLDLKITHSAPTSLLPVLLRLSTFTLTTRMVLTVKTNLMVRIAALALRPKIKLEREQAQW